MSRFKLVPDLRKLNLSGIIDSLPERNQEAVTNQMTYLEFLSLLAQDEVLVREQRSYEKRLKKI